MEQLSRAFRNEVHFALRLLVPPRSVLQTLATRENTDLPQFMYSTAPKTSGLTRKSIEILGKIPSRKKKYTKSRSSKDPTKLGLLRYVESNCGVLKGSRYMIGSTPQKYKQYEQRSDNCVIQLNKYLHTSTLNHTHYTNIQCNTITHIIISMSEHVPVTVFKKKKNVNNRI